MKRTIVAMLLLLGSTAAFAEDTQRYLVATRRPFRNDAVRAVIRDLRSIVSPRAVVGFQTFDGFAADLTASEVAALRMSREVRWVEPVLERHAFAVPRNPGGQTVPYGVDVVHAREAWSGRRTGVVNVAVVDSGIDSRHVELKEFFAGGINLYDPSAVQTDEHGHGTHIAGTITAADNTTGVVGVAPGVRLWGVRILNPVGTGTTEMVVKGIDWVVAKQKETGGNWIMNLSLGGANPSAAEGESINRAIDAGILVVAASGNESFAEVKAGVSYPAAYPGVLAVGAIDQNLNVADFSNQGPELDLVAPGVDILSTAPVGSVFITSVRTAQSEYQADPVTGSTSGQVTAEFVDCGFGRPQDFPASVRGKIAVIKRGDIVFAMKARNAVEAGAAAVIIFNNDDTTGTNWTLLDVKDNPWVSTYEFPIVLALTKKDGEALLKERGPITVMNDPDDYFVTSGTSMAAPHVSGAAALLWGMAPQASAADVANALIVTANDRGPAGHDAAYGAGIVNVLAAAKLLAPSAFPAGPTTGRPLGKRGRG